VDPRTPLLRRLSARALRRGAEDLVELRDPLGLALGAAGAGEPLYVPRSVWEVARLFDGHTQPTEIAAQLARRGGTAPRVTAEEVQRVARGFSEKLLLEDARSGSAAIAAWDELRAQSVRPARGPGRDYEPDPLELRIRVGGIVANDWDMPSPPGLHALFSSAASLARAAPLYARTYAAVRHAAPEIARVLLLGSARGTLDALLAPSRVPYATPLGELRLDREGLAALALEPGRGELAHRATLTLERHALFLRLLMPGVPVLPLLVGSLPERLPDAQSDPRGYEPLERALEALARVEALPGNCLIVCAFDLAQLSSGSSEPLAHTPSGAQALRELDRACVDRAALIDAAGFWQRGLELPGAERVANLSAPYLALRLLEARAERGAHPIGSVLGYVQSVQVEDLVAGLAMAFHEPVGEPVSESSGRTS
jgi:AmmeMemoRadiSam system protein B